MGEFLLSQCRERLSNYKLGARGKGVGEGKSTQTTDKGLSVHNVQTIADELKKK